MIKNILKKIVYWFPSSIVLMLHKITEELDINDSCSLTKSNFEFLIAQFSNWATIDDIVLRKHRKKICLTFDDGYIDIYEKVYPICRSKNIPFTIFINYGLLDLPGYLTKNQLIELSKDPLVTIGSHNIRHIPLPTLCLKAQEEEIIHSKELLEALIGKPVKFLAYPFGQYNRSTIKILKTSKRYVSAFVAGGLCYNWVYNRMPYRIPRLFVANSVMDSCLAKIRKYTE